MRRMRHIRFLYIIVFQSVFLSASLIDVYAAYVGNPSRIFISRDEERPYSMFIEGIADIIYDRKAEFQTDDMEVEFYGAEAGLIYKNTCILYGGAGTARVEETYTTKNKKVRWESDYGFTYLIGSRWKVYEKDLKDFYNSRLLFDLDIQWRNTNFDPDSISIDSTEYNLPHSEISYSSMEYNDWHLAMACALDMGIFSPYAGIKYSDFESCVRVMRAGTLYERDNAEGDDNFGVFAGCSFKVLDSLRAHIEAGFIDEDSISASLSWKF